VSNRARTSRFVRWVVLPVALFAACGGDETTSPSQHGSSGSAGASGAAGTSATGGTAGSAGMDGGQVDIRSPRRCGHGVACSAGAECAVSAIETGIDCKCDPSGHFFCDAWASAGSPGQPLCPPKTGCTGIGGSGGTDDGRCSLSNGYCTRTCVCPLGTCSTDCSGAGPAASEGKLCDLSYCEDTGRYGGCSIKDGSCSYAVECGGAAPAITGSCD
jgi:hypothetical protein